ncbi:BamA/TamA family outer membrane protein [Pelistega europaea]|uniref:BamA/TamA family outer membrane protein n=1 Tax=Pelistega europaea TaxID=106147 RepID=A0A7Y4L9Z1_9BURK|nr:BamA/TamA family outer membrane protein [Pelistega europaea]NOL49729.1 BamA/TamA family outer membrane protein [Pelistega europaea]
MKKLFLLSLLSASAQAGAVTISDVGIEGNSSIPEDALMLNLNANGLVKGQTFDADRLALFRQQVLDHYHYLRHEKAKVDTHVEHLANQQVKITISIDEQPPELQQTARVADPYDADIYTDETEASSMSETDDPDEISGQDDGPEGNISLGVGYGIKGAHAKITAIKRKFLGTDASVRVSGLHNKYETIADLSYSKPRIFKSNVRFDGNLFFEDFDNGRSRTLAEYQRQSYGLGLRFTLPIDQNSSSYAGIRYTHNRIKTSRPEYYSALYLASIKENAWKFDTDEVDLLFGWKYDGLNKKFLPTKGIGMTLDGTISAPGSDSKYYKFVADIQGFYPLNQAQTWVIGAKATAGYANGIDENTMPFYQNFIGGGIGSIRGFAYGSIGPRAVYAKQSFTGVPTNARLYTETSDRVIGGNAMAGGSIELIVPSFYMPEKFKNTVRTSIFVDALSVWNTRNSHPLTNNDSFANNIRASGGVSVQWKFPMGVLAVSYAIPFKKQVGDRQERFQINLSGSF